MINYSVIFTYNVNSIDKAWVLNLINNHIPFKKEWIYAYPYIRDRDFYSDDLIEKCIDQGSQSFSVMEESEDNDIFNFFVTLSAKQNFLTISWHFNKVDFITEDLLKLLTQRNDFACGVVFDTNYVMKESETGVQSYLQYGGNLSNVTLFQNQITDRQEIDISKNYGRRKFVTSYLFVAAPNMWFGEKMIELIGKDRLMSFKSANAIKELSNGVVFIDLFDPKESSKSEGNRTKQKDFREWVAMDKLEVMA